MTGPLPPVTAMKRTLLTAAAAGAWFLPGHLAILGLLVFIWGTAMASTTNSAKTRSTEARLAAHVVATAPAVSFVANGGSVGGSVTVNGNHTVTGALGVHAGGTVVGAQWTMTAGADVTGGLNSDTLQSSGSTTVLGNFGVHGVASVLGNMGVASLVIAGKNTLPTTMPTGAAAPPINTSTASQCAGAFYTGSGAANWATNVTNALNGINNALANAGIW